MLENGRNVSYLQMLISVSPLQFSALRSPEILSNEGLFTQDVSLFSKLNYEHDSIFKNAGGKKDVKCIVFLKVVMLLK